MGHRPEKIFLTVSGSAKVSVAMVTISVFYPRSTGSRFDYDYYTQTHVPLVQAKLMNFGLVKAEIMRGLSHFDGGQADFELIGLLTFSSLENMNAGLASAGAEIIADIPNFTDMQPLIQVNQQIAL
jgi:uncharacterized protein (TIGR02118 family)